MLFKEFAVQLLSQGEQRDTFIELFKEIFPWSKSATFSNEVTAESNLSELVASIYLCQGRFGATYRKRRPGKLNKEKALDQFQQISTIPKQRYLAEVYNTLKNAAPWIELWLDDKGSMPEQVKELVTEMASQEEREFLGRVLTGPWYEDEWLLAFLAQYASISGVDRKTCQKRIERVYRTTLSDLGYIAGLLWKDPKNGFWNVEESVPLPGLPLKLEKIGRLDTPDLAWPLTGPCYVQPKYDGWQIQIHKDGENVWLFGRDQEDLTGQFPDIVEACRIQLSPESVILDGEIIGFDHKNELLPLEQVLAASKRKVAVFDVLLLDGQDYRGLNYGRRRAKLKGLLPIGETATIFAVEEDVAKSPDELTKIYNKWIEDKRFEGVIVKRPDREYTTTGPNDGKWKIKNYISLDLVVVGYRLSRTGLPMLFVGAWDENRKNLITISNEVSGVKLPRKLASKLLDELKEMEVKDKPSHVISDVAPMKWVMPELVVEVYINGRRVRDKRFVHADYSKLPDFAGMRTFRKRPDNVAEDADTLTEFFNLPLAPGEV
ncbi:MAG: hypothetical protein BroJett011_18210 [Chloroflexota bacterium]|nr:MAG: hypothetical protein BroJett011_18210 [Chloroflexota bacterium]